jgi:NADPH2:quinone reductase
MRAVQVKEFGGPEVLVPVELPDPVPGPGEVVIDVAYVDTIFVETQVGPGGGGEWFQVAPPYVPGGGVSGVVGAVGAGVPGEWLGRRVTSYVTGGYAERAVAAVSALTVVPDGLDLRSAAALVHDGVTANGLLDLTAVGPGDRVLILGASGGMGTLLVQLAHERESRWPAGTPNSPWYGTSGRTTWWTPPGTTGCPPPARHSAGPSRGRTSSWTVWAATWGPRPCP